MQWDEIHGDIWKIPKEKMKATRVDKAKAHEVPLSQALAEIISQQPRKGPFVFTVSGLRPFGCGSREKVRIGKAAGITDWRLHDIRRTGATLMTTGTENWQRQVNNGSDFRTENVKTNRFIVERVLGHADTGVTAVYDRSSYRDEKREGLEILAASVGQRGGPNFQSKLYVKK